MEPLSFQGSYPSPDRIYCLHQGHDGPAHHTAAFFSPTWLLTRRSWIHICTSSRYSWCIHISFSWVPAPWPPFMSNQKLFLLFYRLNQPASCLIHSELAFGHIRTSMPRWGAAIKSQVPSTRTNAISKIVLGKRYLATRAIFLFVFPFYIIYNKNELDHYRITQDLTEKNWTKTEPHPRRTSFVRTKRDWSRWSGISGILVSIYLNRLISRFPFALNPQDPPP